MGGIIRTNKAMKIFYGGDQDPQKIYTSNGLKWSKPIPSVYPIREMSNTDDVLFLGSSDMACLTYSCWSPHNHNWPNVFRTDYEGSMETEIAGQLRYGMRSANTLGRVTISTIVNNAENGQYGDANPFTNMGDFNAIVIDTSDDMLPNFRDESNFPNAPDYLALSQMPSPYHWVWQHGRQRWLIDEFENRMKLIREAHSHGIDKIYLTVPWPRLNVLGVGQDLVTWYNTKFQNLEDSMHYQQDRINYQIEKEGLGTHINMIPFHLILKRIYEDILAETAPASLTSIRCMFALNDNLSTDDATSATAPKHWYMLNQYGTYAINALFAAVVLGVDPRGRPRTDGYYTIPQDIATYLQNLTWDIANTYARAGRTRENPGYVMPKIRDQTPSEILGNDLLANITTRTSPSISYPLVRAASVRHLIALMEVDTANFKPSTFTEVLYCRGGGTDGAFVTMYNSPSNVLAGQAAYSQTDLEAITTSNFQLRGTTARLLVDVEFPYPGYVNKFGTNMFVQFTQIDVPWDEWFAPRAVMSSLSTPGVLQPVSNRVLVPNANVTGLEIIVSARSINDADRFNIFRYLSRKYQQTIWEPLTPDIIV